MVALTLEIILKVSFSFDKQIVIDGLLLKHRNISFENSLRDFCLDGFDFHFWTRFDF